MGVSKYGFGAASKQNSRLLMDNIFLLFVDEGFADLFYFEGINI